MNSQQITEIQQEAKKLRIVADAMCASFPHFPAIAIIAVALQNIGFSGVSQSFRDKEAEIKEKRELIRLIHEYDRNDHFVAYLYEQFDMAVTSIQMSEEIHNGH